MSKDTIEQDSFGFGQSRNGTSGSTIGGRASSGSSVTQTLEGKKSLSALAAYNGKILTASTTALKPQQKHSK